MKKYAITHEDGTKDVFTTRFTQEELCALLSAVDVAFGDLDVFRRDAQEDAEKLRAILMEKLHLRGVNERGYNKFYNKYLDTFNE
jgi:hypothetical protein